jgi:hypothetical protein
MTLTLRRIERNFGETWSAIPESLGRDRSPVFPSVAVGFAAAVALTALVTGAYTHEVPAQLGRWAGTGWPALLRGRWWTLGSSFLLTRDWFMASTMPVCLVLGLAAYERRAGHVRTFLVAVIGHVTGTVIVAMAFAPLALTHVPMLVRAADNVDYGGSMAIAAGLGALVGFVGDRRLTVAAVVILAGGLLLHHQMSDWGHAVALPLGDAIARARRPRDAALLAAGLVTATVVAVGAIAGFGS